VNGDFRPGKAWQVAWLPRLEFTGPVFAAGGAQFSDNLGILRGKPILQLVERFHRGEHGRRNFNGFRFHAQTIPCIRPPVNTGCGLTKI